MKSCPVPLLTRGPHIRLTTRLRATRPGTAGLGQPENSRYSGRAQRPNPQVMVERLQNPKVTEEDSGGF